MEKKPLSIKDVEQFTTFSSSKIRRDMRAGTLAYLKVGRRILFLEKDVVDYLERHRVPAKIETPKLKSAAA